MLSTFVGSFLFSIVGLVVLRTGAYGERGRAVLFVVTIGVLALIVVSLLRWIDHLNRLGRVGETTNRVEQATREAITARLETPALGGAPLLDPERDVPPSADAIGADAIGYVEHLDVPGLAKSAEAFGGDIFVAVLPAPLSIRTPLSPGSMATRVAAKIARPPCAGPSRSGRALLR